MATPVKYEQFIVTAEGITHKPTGAKFTPHAGSPLSGNLDYGQLGNVLENGEDFRPEEVKAMMEEIWAGFLKASGRLPEQ